MGLSSETAKYRGEQITASNALLNSSLSCGTDVHGTDTNIMSTEAQMNDSKHEDNQTTSLSKPDDDVKDVSEQGDRLEKATADADNEDIEVKFVIPELQQTAEHFDFRQFIVDVEQLAASLQAVVHRQAAEDFQEDRLAEMVSAVVGTMHNFKAFASRVYNMLETIRDQMKSATDFMRWRILQPTEWDKGKSYFV